MIRTLSCALLVLGALWFVPAGFAQFPAISPVIETRMEWTELQAEPHNRTLKLDETGVRSIPTRAGFRILAPGGYIVCAPGTIYRFSIATDAVPPWLQASLRPEEDAIVSVSVPQGSHQNGWPGLRAWHWQPAASVELSWQLSSVPDNATAEFKVAGQGAVVAAAGGCQPDPLAQPVRHIAESLNVTKPYVRPPPPTTAPADGCDLGDANACQTIVPVATEETSAPRLELVLVAGLVAAIIGRRRHR